MTNTPEARTTTGEIIDQSKAPLTETKPDEQAPVDTTKPTDGVPEKYEFAASEGQQLDAAAIERATPIFKELGLSQDAAQKLVDFHNAELTAMKKSTDDGIIKMQEQWRNELKADKEIGGKIDAVKTNIGRALNQIPAEIRTPFQEAMNLYGIGDNPAFVKAFNALASLVNEGTNVSGAGPSPHGQSKSGQTQRPTLASAMYPNLPQ